MFLRTVYKPHSVRSAEAPLCDHLSGRCVAAPLGATYPGLALSSHERARMKTSRLPPSADGFVPTWSCSRRGLPGHPHYCGCRWSFTPPFHHHRTSPSPTGSGVRGLFVSVALIRQVSSSRRVPRPGCYPTPCSVECGLSSVSTTQDRDRPTDLRKHYHTRKATERQQPACISNNFPKQNFEVDNFVNCQISLEFFIKDIKIRIESVAKCRIIPKQVIRVLSAIFDQSIWIFRQQAAHRKLWSLCEQLAREIRYWSNW